MFIGKKGQVVGLCQNCRDKSADRYKAKQDKNKDRQGYKYCRTCKKWVKYDLVQMTRHIANQFCPYCNRQLDKYKDDWVRPEYRFKGCPWEEGDVKQVPYGGII